MRRPSLFFAMLVLLVFSCESTEESSFTASSIVEGTVVKVSAQTGGQILQMDFDEGDDVELGATIAVLDSEKLVLQREQIEAGLDEIAVQHEISRNTLSQTRSAFDNVERKHRRIRELFEKKSASQQALDDISAAFDAASAQLNNARQNLKAVEARARGLRAQHKLLKRQLEDTRVVAPIAGVLTTKYHVAGEVVAPGLPIAEMIDLNEMWTKVYVSERLLAGIELGGDVEIRIDGTAESLTGKVAWISAKAEFTPKTILTEESRMSLVYAVKITIANPEHVLKHGMPAVAVMALR